MKSLIAIALFFAPVMASAQVYQGVTRAFIQGEPALELARSLRQNPSLNITCPGTYCFFEVQNLSVHRYPNGQSLLTFTGSATKEIALRALALGSQKIRCQQHLRADSLVQPTCAMLVSGVAVRPLTIGR